MRHTSSTWISRPSCRRPSLDLRRTSKSNAQGPIGKTSASSTRARSRTGTRPPPSGLSDASPGSSFESSPSRTPMRQCEPVLRCPAAPSTTARMPSFGWRASPAFLGNSTRRARSSPMPSCSLSSSAIAWTCRRHRMAIGRRRVGGRLRHCDCARREAGTLSDRARRSGRRLVRGSAPGRCSDVLGGRDDLAAAERSRPCTKRGFGTRRATSQQSTSSSA